MNREGYRDPTAEKAISRVSRSDVTRGQLIRYCRSRPQSFSCDLCGYDAECSAFVKDTGHVPYTMEPEDLGKEYLDEIIRVRKRRRKE